MAKIATKSVVRVEGIATGVTIEFTDGKSIVANLDDFPETIRAELAAHGLAQKLGDSYSGEKSPKAAYAEADGVLKALLDGDWNRRGQGVASLLVEALVNLTNATEGAVRSKLAGMSDEEKKELQKHAQVKAEVARLRAAKLAALAGGDDTPLEL